MIIEKFWYSRLENMTASYHKDIIKLIKLVLAFLYARSQ